MILDPNLITPNGGGREDTVWYDGTISPFDLYGVDKGKDDLFCCRIPEDVARNVNGGVYGMRAFAAGGRIRFGTDSPYILIKAEFAGGKVPRICSYCFAYGFDLYTCDERGREDFCHLYRVPDTFDEKSYISAYDVYSEEGFAYYTLNFPCFSEVEKLYIGLKKDCKLTGGLAYTNQKPVVFYGSSITHGAAASRPGNTYEAFISQKYNLNYVNLGFAGNAKGETQMAEYIAGREMDAFVCDYDHNAPNAEHLKNTHYRFYEIIRKKHVDIPYIMISKPDYRTKEAESEERRRIIKESYVKAREHGDDNVYFIDGETLFEGEFVQSCTTDGCHPNDLGFYRMASVIGALLEKILKLK